MYKALALWIFFSVLLFSEIPTNNIPVTSTLNGEIVSENVPIPNTQNRVPLDDQPEYISSPEERDYEDLLIEADTIKYLEKNDFVEASGNVILLYKNIKVTASVTQLDIEKEQLNIKGGFVFKRSESLLVGDALQYDFQNEKGVATKVTLDLSGTTIKGKQVTILKDKIIIEDAVQTTCPTNAQCNRLEAKTITVYPEWGDVVASKAVFYVGRVPIMYVPNYVTSRGGSYSGYMDSIIPKFGFNPIEGNYIKLGLGYYKNEKFNGTYDVHFLSELGGRVGFTNNYKLSQSTSGQFRLHYLVGLGGRASFGLQHRYLIGVLKKERDQIIDEFFMGILPPSKTEYPEFVIDITNRELINYQFISLRPQLSLFSPNYETIIPTVYHGGNISIADIYEEGRFFGTKQLSKGTFRYYINRPTNLGRFGSLHPEIIYNKAGYHDFGRLAGAWKRFYYNLNYSKFFNKIDFRAGYKNTFEESGISPFEFDTFNISTKEETNYTIFFQLLDNLKLSYHQDYSITDKKLRNTDYGMEITWCCFDFSFYWYDTQSRFAFNIGL